MLKLSNERHSRIIYILLEREIPITTKELAVNLGVSTRTIRKDLKQLKKHLIEKNIILHTKPGLGVWLEIESSNKLNLRERLIEREDYHYPFSPKERTLQIIRRLLLSEQELTMQFLGEELYVSRSTIYSDLKNVEGWLQKYDLYLKRKRNYGIKIEGKEKNLREAMVNLLFEIIDQEELEAISNLLINNCSINIENYEVLKEFCFSIDLNIIKNIIDLIEVERRILFTREAILYLCFYISIGLKRIAKNRLVNLPKEDLKRLKKNKFDEFQLAKVKANQLEEKLGIKISDNEVGVALLHFLCVQLYKDNKLKDKKDILNRVDKVVVEIAEEIISVAEVKLSVSLIEDEKLFLELILHLRNIINHFTYEINNKKSLSINENILNEIKKSNYYIFVVAKESENILKRHLNETVNEVNIDYIALLLLAALERKKSKAQAFVICNNENPICQLMVARLNSKVAGLEIMDVLYYHEVDKKKLKKADIIISSKSIDQFPDVIVITPLVTEKDIKLLKNKIDLLQQEKLNLL